MTRRQRRRLLITTAILLCVASVLSLLFVRGVFDQFQRRLTDTFFVTKASSPQMSQNIVLVAIDDKSIVALKPYGRFFGWPRTLHAQVVRQLAEARARTIVFDVLFDVPGQGDDDRGGDRRGRPDRHLGGAASAADPLGRRDLARTPTNPSPICSSRRLLQGVPEMLASPTRRQTATARSAECHSSSMSMASRTRPCRCWQSRSSCVARQPGTARSTNSMIPLAGREIPIDARGDDDRQLRGRPVRDVPPPTFPVVSFVDVLNGRVPPETFAASWC